MRKYFKLIIRVTKRSLRPFSEQIAVEPLWELYCDTGFPTCLFSQPISKCGPLRNRRMSSLIRICFVIYEYPFTWIVDLGPTMEAHGLMFLKCLCGQSRDGGFIWPLHRTGASLPQWPEHSTRQPAADPCYLQCFRITVTEPRDSLALAVCTQLHLRQGLPLRSVFAPICADVKGRTEHRHLV